jgi:hypothetical protein
MIEVMNMPVFNVVRPLWKAFGQKRSMFHFFESNDEFGGCEIRFE